MIHSTRILLLLYALASSACSWMQPHQDKQLEPWQNAIAEQTKELGVNNWIIVCEASFPALNKQGIRQINAPTDLATASDYTLQALEQTEHVRPQIYQTREFTAVENSTAPGINDFRKKITTALHHYPTTTLDQNAIITLVQEAAKRYQVLVIRTNTALPYTSVFMQLQPGYWDGDAENQLRQKLNPPQAPPAPANTTAPSPTNSASTTPLTTPATDTQP